MVRHEAGEALGAIGDPSSREILKEYKNVIFKRLFQNSFVSNFCLISGPPAWGRWDLWFGFEAHRLDYRIWKGHG